MHVDSIFFQIDNESKPSRPSTIIALELSKVGQTNHVCFAKFEC